MSAAQWEPYRALLPEVELVTVDLPGHGSRTSETFTGAAALATIEAAVREAEDAARADGAEGDAARPVLAGHSLGGYLAMMWAARHTEALGALVLIGATADPRGPWTGVYRGFARLLPVIGTERMARGANAVMRGLGARGEHAAALPDGAAYAALPAAWEVVMTQVSPALLEHVACPVVLVNGQFDQMRLHVDRFAAAASDPRVVTVPRASHLMPATHPEQVAQVLRSAMALAG